MKFIYMFTLVEEEEETTLVSDEGEELFQIRGRSCFRRGGGVVSEEGEELFQKRGGVLSEEGEELFQVRGKSCFR